MSSGIPENPNSLPSAAGSGLRRLGESQAVRGRASNAPATRSARALPPALVSNLGLMDLVRGARRRLPQALVLGLLLGSAVSLGAWFCLPLTKYSANALLHVDSTPPRFLFTTMDTASMLMAGNEFHTYQQTQDVILRSRYVLGDALGKPEIANLHTVLEHQPDPISWLAEKLGVSFTGEILKISLEGDHPDEIIALVNTVTASYMKNVVQVDRQKRLARFDQLKTLYEKYQNTLAERRDKLKKLAQAAGSNNKQTLAYRHQLALQRLAEAERELSQIRADLRAARMEQDLIASIGPRVRTARTATAAPAPTATPDVEIDRDPAIQQYQRQFAELQAKLNQYRHLARRDDDPSIRYVRHELDACQASLTARRADVRKQLAERQQVTEQSTTDDSRQLLALRIKLLTKYETELTTEVDTLASQTQTINSSVLDVEALQDEIRIVENTSEKMAQEVEALRVELDAPDRVRPIEEATNSIPTSSKKFIAAIAVSGLSTFGMILFGFAWWDARGRRVDSVDNVIHGLGLNLVGVLPGLAPPSRRRAIRSAGPDWDQFLMESVDATRTMLLHTSRAESLRILMVTSAVKGEGKTSLSCHLAASLARARQRTLLIDGDLRSPTTHHLFDLLPAPGVCEILRGEADLTGAIQATSAPGLSLLPAGHCDAEAIQALAHGNLQNLLDRVRDQYDFIIIDSAPVLPVADSLQICQHADAVILSVLRDVSSLPKIHAAYERIAKLGVRILGAVVAGARVEDYDSSYHYTYGGEKAKSTTATA